MSLVVSRCVMRMERFATAMNRQIIVNMIVSVIMLLVRLDHRYTAESAALEAIANEGEGKALVSFIVLLSS